MASKAEDKPVAIIKPVEQTDEKEAKEPVEIEESQEEDDEEASDEEEIILDEPSDTEDYAPPEEKADEEGDGDVSCSSGEEEEGVNMEEVKLGGAKLFKLRFEDIEAKRKEYLKMMEEEAEEKDHVEEEENLEVDSEEVGEDKENQKPSAAFREYRTSTILDEDMEKDYHSEEDDDFNPVYCGETLSDVEYGDGDERDTESEPETEHLDGAHKKTGENLICIKMIEQLNIPPQSAGCATGCSPLRSCGETSGENPMECS